MTDKKTKERKRSNQFINLEEAARLSEAELAKESYFGKGTYVDLRKEVLDKIKIQEQKNEKLDQKIENNQIRIIETLGIFVALFTFISIEFQAFRQITNLQAIAGMTLIMLGSLSYFIILLDIILNINLSNKKYIKKAPSGAMSAILHTIHGTFGYPEEVQFKLFDFKTWGEGFKFKILLIFLCVFMIGLGIYCFATVHYIVPMQGGS